MSSSKFTPMMKQYVDTKKKYPEGILLFRAGDFYEMFYDDAKEASKILNITLTKRGKGETTAPLAGIPYHSIDPYINKLVKAGKKVVICEQVEDPKKTKKLVKREVTRIITPSTLFTDNYENNYLCSISKINNIYGFSIIDITTGEFKVGNYDNFDDLLDELNLIKPKELLFTKNILDNYKIIEQVKKILPNTIINYSDNNNIDLSDNKLKEHFNINSLEVFGIDNKKEIILSSYNALEYIKKTQFSNLKYIKNIKLQSNKKYLRIDRKTSRNLELVSNLKDNTIKNSLFDLLNNTKTAMGYRKLYFDILHPKRNIVDLKKDYNSIKELSENILILEDLKDQLNYICDLDRIISKIGFGNSNPRDLISLKQSLEVLPLIKNILNKSKSKNLIYIKENINILNNIYELIDQAIVNDPPFSIREGNFIKSTYSKELENIIITNNNIKSWLKEYEAKLRYKTGIKSIKLKYNKIFGYYLEVPKAHSSKVPSYFQRKQTLVNCERYTTDELSEKENIVLHAKEKRYELEFNIFQELCKQILEYQKDIQNLSKLIGQIDVYYSHAQNVLEHDYTYPNINNSNKLEFKDLRHPVIEKLTNYIPNDCILDLENRTMIITGPNMAGKSSYMRSVCLAVILAYSGSFVPAKSSNIGVIDGVFTRVGASDDILHGQSTFLVEMSEVAYILNNATKNSLVILDEVGRGTSTYDGISLAWAIVEYLNNLVKCKTLVATHYHILNKMQEVYSGINNYHVTAAEEGDDLHFYHKLEKGGINKSYGIQVAKLAGIKNKVINNALLIQRDLENNSFLKKPKKIIESQDNNQTIDSEKEEKPKINKNNKDPEQKSLFAF
jgi:DNA mismatch repair protein MutS